MGDTEERKATDQEERQTTQKQVTTFTDLSSIRNTLPVTTPSTFQAAREITRQSTRPVPKQGNIFSILNPKAAKHALMLQENGNLLSTITDGIDGSPLTSKVIKALSQVQYEQSLQTDNRKLLTGLSEDKIKEITKETISLPAPQDYGETNKSGGKVKTPFSYIVIDSIDFTKKVNGVNRLGGKDKEAIMDILTDLERKEVFIDLKNGHYRGTKLLTILGRDIDSSTGREVLFVQLSPIFARAISHDYVTYRSDTLLMMRGKQSKVTMKLFDILIEAHSYRGSNSKQKNDRLFKMEKGMLFDRIAPLQSYKKNPKRRATDFAKAVDLMKEWLLITDYHEEDKTGCIICVFHLNPEYRTAPTPQKYLPKKN